nr:hypothetical protein [Tanacetum cinerariifolium]
MWQPVIRQPPVMWHATWRPHGRTTGGQPSVNDGQRRSTTVGSPVYHSRTAGQPSSDRQSTPAGPPTTIAGPPVNHQSTVVVNKVDRQPTPAGSLVNHRQTTGQPPVNDDQPPVNGGGQQGLVRSGPGLVATWTTQRLPRGNEDIIITRIRTWNLPDENLRHKSLPSKPMQSSFGFFEVKTEIAR